MDHLFSQSRYHDHVTVLYLERRQECHGQLLFFLVMEGGMDTHLHYLIAAFHHECHHHIAFALLQLTDLKTCRIVPLTNRDLAGVSQRRNFKSTGSFKKFYDKVNIYNSDLYRVRMRRISPEIFHEIYDVLRKKSIFLLTFVSPSTGRHTNKFSMKCFN